MRAAALNATHKSFGANPAMYKQNDGKLFIAIDALLKGINHKSKFIDAILGQATTSLVRDVGRNIKH